MGKTLLDYGLPEYDAIDQDHETVNRDIYEELKICIKQDHIIAANNLNMDQQIAYSSIMERVLHNKPGAFFIDGPGGTGKTYLYCALLATIRSRRLVAIATATSGVAASIMPGGRTAHSRFKIPINLDDMSNCSVSKQSKLAELLRISSVIIWDEASMAKRQAIEALDRMLQDIMNCCLLFGGKVVIFGGDFRQVLPVTPRATIEESIDASLVKSHIWPLLEKFKLKINMRARLDGAFSDFLLRVGNGTEPHVIDGKIRIPHRMVLPYKNERTMNQLVDIVFPNISSYSNEYDSIVNRAILTPKNDFVDELNSMLIEKFPGVETKYYSHDEAIDSTVQAVEEDFLNNLTPSGFPPHELLLKQNCPIILLRNLDPSQGMSNGTRLICKSFRQNVIEAEIANGDHCKKRVFIPRIPFLPNEDAKNPFQFRRTQFPVRLSFAMTINKAQGQTLDFVGIYLPYSVFSHGQLYVALSRAQTSKNVCVLIRPSKQDKKYLDCTHNTVYSELLELANV